MTHSSIATFVSDNCTEDGLEALQGDLVSAVRARVHIRHRRRWGVVSVMSILVALPVAGGALQTGPSPGATLIAYVGVAAGTSSAYTSTGPGAPWTAAPSRDLPDAGSNAFPVLGDLDGDGDSDAMVGESLGRMHAFRNDGT